MHVMVDSCVLLDVFTRDPRWYRWSADTLAQLAERDRLVINPVIYSEISVNFDRIELLEDELPADTFEFRPIPREAAFLAGKCFLQYKRRGGNRPLPLPDFFIGAHAAVAGMPLATRDATRFKKYFPKLELIRP